MAESNQEFAIAGFPKDEEYVAENEAPMIRNAWCVIAEAQQVDRNRKTIEALGEPLVYFRTEQGEPIVLDDRCAHRRYSLSRGALIGDNVRCGYHGFTYNTAGRCIKAPGFGRELGFGVRSYPAKEYGPWLWVWMGEPEKADPALIPLEDPTYEPDRCFQSYKMNPGNYMLLIENLLDLTHIPFLHANAGSNEGWAEVKLEAIEMPNGAGWEKQVENDKQSPEMAAWTGGAPDQTVHSYTNARQFGPAFHDSVSFYKPVSSDAPEPNPGTFYVAHAVTPQNGKATHQFSFFRMDRPLALPQEQLRKVFEELIYEDDAVAIKFVQDNLDRENREGKLEFGTVNDRFGLKMRRILRDLKQQEAR